MKNKKFLQLFDPGHRSFVANQFAYSVREGAQDAKKVLADVSAQARQKAYRNANWARLKSALATDPDAARVFAEYIIEWEKLTPQQKENVRAAQNAQFVRQWMYTQPPTDKQVRELRRLGYTGHMDSKGHASDLIDQIRAVRGAA